MENVCQCRECVDNALIGHTLQCLAADERVMMRSHQRCRRQQRRVERRVRTERLLKLLAVVVDHDLGVGRYRADRLVEHFAADQTPDNIDRVGQLVHVTHEADPIAVAYALAVHFLDLVEATEAVPNLTEGNRQSIGINRNNE